MALKVIIIVLLFVDLLVFNIAWIAEDRFILASPYPRNSLMSPFTPSPDYYNFLKDNNILQTKHEAPFINSRSLFAIPPTNSYPPNNTFFGCEIYNVRKIIFPVVLLREFLMRDDGSAYTEIIVPVYDHFYMTIHYYDYLVNVNLIRQLATSGMVFPIINFFPEDHALHVENKYEAVKQINQLSIAELGKYIFIERSSKPNAPSSPINFYDTNNYFTVSQKEISYIKKHENVKYAGNNIARFKIKDYNVNKLDLMVDTPVAGRLFFGDGYSKHWKAFVDNKKVKIEKTNINFKSVFVPRGRHEVFFKYDPVLFRHALYIYFAGLLMTLFVLIIYFNPLHILNYCRK